MGMRRLLLLSNRVSPIQTSGANRGATGGLAVAIHDALTESRGVWCGWSGKVVEDDHDRVAQQVQQENYEHSTIDLTEAEHGAYYNGYSNEVLWPVLHYRPDLMNYHSSHFEAYRRVNELFADHLAQQVRSNDLIWIHDYHLMLAA